MWYFPLLEMDTRDRQAAQGTMSCDLGGMVTHTRSTGEMQVSADIATFGQNSGGKIQSQWVSVGAELT